MSVVAGKVYKDKIVIASDTIVCRGQTMQKGYTKLVEINGMIIGGCGFAEESSLLFRFAQTRKPETADKKDILAFFVDFAEWNRKYTGENCKNQYLFAYGGRLFRIHHLLVDEVTEYEAIGAGEDYALAALYLGHSPMDAVNVACQLCCYVSEPIDEKIMVRSEEVKK